MLMSMIVPAGAACPADLEVTLLLRVVEHELPRPGGGGRPDPLGDSVCDDLVLPDVFHVLVESFRPDEVVPLDDLHGAPSG